MAACHGRSEFAVRNAITGGGMRVARPERQGMAQSLRGAGPGQLPSEADRVSAGLRRALHAAAQPAPEPAHLAECSHCGALNGLSASRCWHCAGDLQVNRQGEPEQFFAAIVEGADSGGRGEAVARPTPLWSASSPSAWPSASASAPASASAAPSRPRRPPSAVSPRRGRAPSGGVLLLGVVVVAASLQGAAYYFGHDTEVDPAAARSAGNFAARPVAAPAPASGAADAIAAQIAAALERADRAIAGTPAATEQPKPPDAAAVAALERAAPATDPASTGIAQSPAPTAAPPRPAPPIVAQRDLGKPADAWPVAAAVVAAAAARARSGAATPPPRPTSCSAAMAALSLCSAEPAAKGDAR
jgi:hypothetical protein